MPIVPATTAKYPDPPMSVRRWAGRAPLRVQLLDAGKGVIIEPGRGGEMDSSADVGAGRHVDLRYGQGAQIGDHNLMINHIAVPLPVVTWPVLAGRPPLRADAFQERPRLRDAVRQHLTGAGSTVVIVGDGGTGKTQLATAAFDDARGPGVDLAVWVPATSRSGVISGYAQAHAAVGRSAGHGDAQRDAEAFLSWLATTDRSWIVVLDDVVDPRDLARLWPTGSTGHVVVTTRRRDAALLARGGMVDVDVFTPAEAAAYLHAKLGHTDPQVPDLASEAAALAADVGHLPLALSQAAAVIVDDALTCAVYRALLADRANALRDLFPDDPAVSGDEYDRTLAGTWSLAVDRADALAPIGAARPVLAVASVLDPHGVPEAVLTGPAVRALVGRHSPGDARRALRNLHRLSLVTHDPADAVRSVRMHALAQRSTVESLDRHTLSAAVATAADAVMEVWPEVERDGDLGQVLRACAAVLLSDFGVPAREPGAHPILFRFGRSLGEAGLVGHAVEHFRAAVQDLSRDPGPDHPDTLTARFELGYWQGEAGDFAGAAASQRALLVDRIRVCGADHPDTLGTRANAAYWQGHAGDATGAAAEMAAAVADLERVLGTDRPSTLSARHNLAHFRGAAGDLVGAVSDNERLLADMVRVLGPNHFDTLDTRRNLAHWRGQAGDPAGAVATLERVLTDYLRVLGPDHPDTLHTRDNLAHWIGKAGDPAGAATAYERLLADRLRVLGPDHPHTLTARQGLAEWRGHAGDPQRAVADYASLLDDRLRLLGADHQHTLITRYRLGYWRGEAHSASDAVADLEALSVDIHRVLGPDHPDTLSARHALGHWRGFAGDPAGAVEALREVIDDQLRLLGPDHPAVLTTRHDLAQWQARAGDPAGAAAAFKRLLADETTILGTDHPDTRETVRAMRELSRHVEDSSG
jgi:hypothetical protein